MTRARETLASLDAPLTTPVSVYVILFNHYRFILHVDTEYATGWSEQDIIVRYRYRYR